MKILYTLFSTLFISMVFILSVSQTEARDWNKNPVEILWDTITDKTREILDTPRNETTSKWCTDIGVDSRFTITRTLCYLKNNSWNYLQYVMFIWLVAATILIIRNWFRLVTSPNREKQINIFKKNMIYIIVWITLLLWFYYFIDIYVWIINLFSD
jgi:hypothetical protein